MGLFSINFFHELRKMDLICLLFNYIIRSLFQLFNQNNECLLNTVIRIFFQFPSASFLPSSHIKVLWYPISTWSLIKVDIVKSGLKMPVTYNCYYLQPTRSIFSIRVQWIYNFHFTFQRKTCFVYTMRDRL